MAKLKFRDAQKFSLKKFFQNYPIFLVGAVVFALGVGVGYGLSQKHVIWHKPGKEVVKPDGFQRTAVAAPIVPLAATTIFPKKGVAKPVSEETFPFPEEKILPELVPVEKAEKPKLALVIDDVGYNKKYAELIFSINRPITLAILPQLPYSKYFAEESKKRGIETILHLPLEPEDEEEDPGPGAITSRMNSDEVLTTFEKDLASVPGVIGVNNHMGSRATQDRPLMYLIAKELKRNQLFFLDSMTHSASVAHNVTDAIGVPTLKRDVFLDNQDDFDRVTAQIEEAAQIAKQLGKAVAIGHVREHTLMAIKKAIPRLEAEGIQISSLKDLL